jgi:hypothetical protein
MSRDQLLTGSWTKFADCMGYRDVEDTADHGLFQFHKLIRPMTKDNLGELYIHGRWGLVQSKVLILVYDIRHRLSPKVLNSMVGNFDEIHAFFLLIYCISLT